MAGYSRWARARVRHADPEADPEAAFQAVADAIERRGARVLLPISDAGWRFYFEWQDPFDRLLTVVPHPGRELFERTVDKGSLREICRCNGTPQPRSLLLRAGDAIAPADWPFPSLLKPLTGRSGEGIRRIASPAELRRARSAASQAYLLQEHIEGEDLEATFLCRLGRVLAASTYRAIRMFPRRFGPPAAAETAPAPDVVETGARLLGALDYDGVAHLDFRRDARDGRPKLLDFNARLAGTDEISIRSGVPFAWMLYRLALGRDVEPAGKQRDSVRFQWLFFHDLSWALSGSRKLRDLTTVLGDRRACANNGAWDDPAPQLAQFASGVRKRFARKP